MVRKLNVARDVHDVRDYRLDSFPAVDPPPHVDLRGWAGNIKDQGEEGSCTGHAFSSAREWIARKYEHNEVVLSPQFLYAEELIKNNSFPQDVGSQPRTGCKVLTSIGVCEASLYPYKAGEIVKPNADQIRNALTYRTGAYHRLQDANDLMDCLGDTTPWPVTIGFPVYESFMTDAVAKSGIMPVPKPGEKLVGGHEVLCLGYDLHSEMAINQNSWGVSWGKLGYFMMPFEVINSNNVDMWMVHTGRPWGV